MIQEPTVFVLGAGAHCSYGFPSGPTLKLECASTVHAMIDNGRIQDFLALTDGNVKRADVSAEKCVEFATALRHSGQSSIDAFLHANRHNASFAALGKAMIAITLLNYESRESVPADDDWLDYLFTIMLDGVHTPEEFRSKNRLGFVTFNYDRFLEMQLFLKLKYSFGLSDENSLELLKEIPIHHVYGSLGSFPLDPTETASRWIVASRSIRTIFDVEQNSKVLDAIETLLMNAKRVCLLGFGFHLENISLLKLKERLGLTGPAVFSSRFQITDEEWNRFRRPFADKIISCSPEQMKCRESIRRLQIF